jgi:hypothetical protein
LLCFPLAERYLEDTMAQPLDEVYACLPKYQPEQAAVIRVPACE